MSEKQLKWYEEAGEESDVVISCRVRLARNLKKYAGLSDGLFSGLVCLFFVLFVFCFSRQGFSV